MAFWFLFVFFAGGAGWAMFAAGSWWLVGSLFEFLEVGVLLFTLLGWAVWRLCGGRDEIEQAQDRLRETLVRRGVPDPDAWMGLKKGNEPDVDEFGIPYLR